MNVLDSRTFGLGSTLTYSHRECQWFGKDANGYAGVIIRLWDGKHRRRGSNAGRMGYESDLYAVTEEAPPVGVMARAFTFLNLSDENQELPYRVLVGANNSCTCDAGRAKVPGEKHVTTGCKHRDSLLPILESGWWDGTDDDAGEAAEHELATA